MICTILRKHLFLRSFLLIFAFLSVEITACAKIPVDPCLHTGKITKTHKKLLFVTPGLNVAGGMEHAFVSLLSHISVPASEMDIYLTSGEKSTKGFLPFLRSDLRRVSHSEIRNMSYDVVISFATWISPNIWLGIEAKKRVLWVHTDFEIDKPGWRNWKEAQVHKVDTFVFVSNKAKEGFLRMYPSLERKAIVIYNIVDGPQIRKQTQEPITNAIFDDAVINVVSVARLSSEKGLLRAIEVHNRLNKEGHAFHWYVVGEGGQRRILEEKIKEYGLNDRFILVGEKTNPYPYIKKADIFAVPSLREGFSIVLAEAKILGRPIIATDFAGAREQIISGITGLIVDNDENGLYTGLKQMLMNPNMRSFFSKNLKDFEYDNDASLEAFNKMIKEF